MVVYSVQFSGNGKYLLSSDFDGVVQIYETGKFEVVAKTEKMAENRVFSNKIFFDFLNFIKSKSPSFPFTSLLLF